ncbi:MAG TPA: GC-type dockerin domain-anchored protein [Phycisphaerales bacterium]|nr:GC-type dockerin domain-anchored protein [Phycisphaerales bacterium]
MLRKSSIVAAAVLLCTTAGFAAGQVSRLYMIAYDTNQAVIMQNGQIVKQFTNSGAGKESAMAIHASLRVLGRNPGENGREYDLDGNLLGGGPYTNPAYVDVYDGTTDGTFNYGIAHNDFNTNFAVVRGDANWNNLTVHFVPVDRSSGIAYDGKTNTLWIAGNVGGLTSLMQYDLSGNLLQHVSLSFISGAGYGLAWDPADDTLWITGAFNGGTVDAYQLSKSGAVLQAVDLPGMSATNWISAEILPEDDCFVDCNGDTVINSLDVLCFLNLYTAQDPAADCNGDTVINSLDVLCFLNLYNNPPCP